MSNDDEDLIKKTRIILNLHDINKRLLQIEGPPKRHQWSVQFLELRALQQDLANLKQMSQCIIRDSLIQDIETYLSTGDTLCHSLELKEAEIEDLKSIIEDYDSVVREFKEKMQSKIESEEKLRVELAFTKGRLRATEEERLDLRSEVYELTDEVQTLKAKKKPLFGKR